MASRLLFKIYELSSMGFPVRVCCITTNHCVQPPNIWLEHESDEGDMRYLIMSKRNSKNISFKFFKYLHIETSRVNSWGKKLSICLKLPFSTINSLLPLIFDLGRIEWVLVHVWVSSSQFTIKILVPFSRLCTGNELTHVYVYVNKSMEM